MNLTLNDKKNQILLLIFASLLIFLGRQLDTGITNFDDTYYAQKAKELLESGSIWHITHAGESDWANPPLPFWITALVFSLFGVSSYSAIFSSALFATGIVLTTYKLSLLLYKDTWIAFASAFILLFPGYFLDSSRRAMLDIPLAFFVTLALYAVFKAKDIKSWYLVFGLATAGAILTKSVLGLFPLVIIGAFFIFSRQWKEIINPWFLSGSLIALILGFSWHLISWQRYGQEFLDIHFGMLIFHRGFDSTENPFFFLGYVKDFLRNYWPWLPFALIGLIKFGKRGFIEKDGASLLLFLWPALAFLVMSSSKNQTIRYLFMIFPALAIITAKTISDWLNSDRKHQALAAMTGIIALTILFVNATPLQIKVTLRPSSKEVRELAAIVNLNAPKNQTLGNYRLSHWNPKNAMLFYSDRVMAKNVTQTPEELLIRLSAQPEQAWLTSIEAYVELITKYPNKVYLIQANSKYAFFTSIKNQASISYDFSKLKLPLVR